MIQRIQSLFLLAAIILLSVNGYLYSLTTMKCDCLFSPHTCNIQNCTRLLVPILVHYVYIGLIILQFVLLVVMLFSYKNRKRQIKLASLFLLSCVIMLFPILSIENKQIIPSPFFWLMIASQLLVLLARHFIKKDDDLVRSADRIR